MPAPRSPCLSHPGRGPLSGPGYGGEGLVVSETDKLEETYTAAQAAAKAGKPVLINAYIGKTDFREGSISV